MAASEYAAMERSELEDKLVESRRELFNLRFQKATGQLDNTARLGHVRKEVARILTVLRQQDLGLEEPGPAFGVPGARRATDDAAGTDAADDDAGPFDDSGSGEEEDAEGEEEA